MNAPLPPDDLTLDLLAKRATEGLTREEEAQLEAALQAHPGVAVEALEPVVAAIDLAAAPRHELPASLRAKILAQAPVAPSTPARRASSRLAAQGGWWVAAACFVLAVAGWWPRLASVTPDVARAREDLASRANIVRVQLAAGPGAAGAPLVGDVVFDPVTQTGYLRFRGIPANDPRLAQYQLWIADGARGQPEPVDGGVFNVPATAPNGDVVIPFRAKLAVGAPAAFVITQEQPGGVVVSKQERVLALGKVGSGA